LVRRKIICTILIALMFSLGSVTEAQAFVDVRHHWAEPVVEHLGARDLINGYPDGRFLPNRNITRAEMCRLLTAMLDASDEASALKKLNPVFPDTTAYHWASGDVNYLYEIGVVTGDEAGLFNPDALLRRDEAVVMLLRALKVMALPDTASLNTYTDVAEVPEFALGYIARGIKDGFMQGYPDLTLRPGAPITRAELAVLVERGLNYQGNEYQFWGRLLQWDKLNNRAKMALPGKAEQWIDLASGLKVYSNSGQLINLGSVGLPFSIYFDLDQEGRMAYARAMEQEPVSRLNVESRQLAPAAEQPIVSLSAKEPVKLYESAEQQLTGGYALSNPAPSTRILQLDIQLP